MTAPLAPVLLLPLGAADGGAGTARLRPFDPAATAQMPAPVLERPARELSS
ncbi:hypothetical protein [Brachybacterium sp. sponge]|uniref:hypothetical protein n=1 Tax=Brachybacterium sp. sponge TaxID=1775432 RepID=UPI000A863EDE|nr:hypothetical protein [Brachybacterium sp. sponge]